jgi:hypothetical protein
MRNFKTIIYNHIDKGEFTFECYEHTERINIGDKYLFFFAGTANVFVCSSDKEVEDVNINARHNHSENCFKIKNTDFVLS